MPVLRTRCRLSQASPTGLPPAVSVANQYGVVVFDWSNAKDLWANTHPMTSEELITAQAEAVYAADPGVPGSMPRVWAYRNTCVRHAPR